MDYFKILLKNFINSIEESEDQDDYEILNNIMNEYIVKHVNMKDIFDSAMVCKNKKKYNEAIGKFGLLARLNSVPSKYNIGLILYDNNKLNDAIQWFSQCINEVPNALTKIGICKLLNEDIDVSSRLFQIGIKKQDPEAYHMMALIYAKYNQYNKSFELLNQCMHFTYIKAYSDLGIHYLHGLGVDKNTNLGIKLVETSAQNGFIDGLYEYAKLLYNKNNEQCYNIIENIYNNFSSLTILDKMKIDYGHICFTYYDLKQKLKGENDMKLLNIGALNNNIDCMFKLLNFYNLNKDYNKINDYISKLEKIKEQLTVEQQQELSDIKEKCNIFTIKENYFELFP